MPPNPENPIDKNLELVKAEVEKGKREVKPDMMVHWKKEATDILEKARKDIADLNEFMNS